MAGEQRSAPEVFGLSVVGRAGWDAEHGEPPNPNWSYGPGSGVRVTRIGDHMPDGEDHWWLVTPDTEPAEPGRSVVAAITDHAVPTLLAAD